MGDYTEIYINVDLKEGTPSDVIDVLKAICAKEYRSKTLEHYPARWAMLFNSGSYYTPNTACALLTNESNRWSLLGKGDIKNYRGEIELFFEWIMPWIDASSGEFVGYYRFERRSLPTLVLKSEEDSQIIDADEIWRGLSNAKGASND